MEQAPMFNERELAFTDHAFTASDAVRLVMSMLTGFANSMAAAFTAYGDIARHQYEQTLLAGGEKPGRAEARSYLAWALAVQGGDTLTWKWLDQLAASIQVLLKNGQAGDVTNMIRLSIGLSKPAEGPSHAVLLAQDLGEMAGVWKRPAKRDLPTCEALFNRGVNTLADAVSVEIKDVNALISARTRLAAIMEVMDLRISEATPVAATPDTTLVSA
jgi:hypothetical protein